MLGQGLFRFVLAGEGGVAAEKGAGGGELHVVHRGSPEATEEFGGVLVEQGFGVNVVLRNVQRRVPVVDGRDEEFSVVHCPELGGALGGGRQAQGDQLLIFGREKAIHAHLYSEQPVIDVMNLRPVGELPCHALIVVKQSDELGAVDAFTPELSGLRISCLLKVVQIFPIFLNAEIGVLLVIHDGLEGFRIQSLSGEDALEGDQYPRFEEGADPYIGRSQKDVHYLVQELGGVVEFASSQAFLDEDRPAGGIAPESVTGVELERGIDSGRLPD